MCTTPCTPPIYINKDVVERVSSFKGRGIHISPGPWTSILVKKATVPLRPKDIKKASLCPRILVDTWLAGPLTASTQMATFPHYTVKPSSTPPTLVIKCYCTYNQLYICYLYSTFLAKCTCAVHTVYTTLHSATLHSIFSNSPLLCPVYVFIIFTYIIFVYCNYTVHPCTYYKI